MITVSTLTFNTSLIKVRLLVLDLKLSPFCYKESDLTLAFDPSTLNSANLQELSIGNVVCYHVLHLFPRWSALSPEILPIFAYQMQLGRTKVR